MLNKLAVQIFKDAKEDGTGDLIVVIRDCDKTIEDLLANLLNVEKIVPIPSLSPVPTEEIVKPEIPAEAPKVPEISEPEPPVETPEVHEEKPEPATTTEPTVTEAPPEENHESSTKLVCPNCGNFVEISENGVVCSCGFKMERVACSKTLSDDELVQLLTTGKTDFLEGFVSKAGKPFKASISLKVKTGGYSYSFQK